MKKIIAICLVFVLVSVAFAAAPASAYKKKTATTKNYVSPVAPTWPGDDDDDDDEDNRRGYPPAGTNPDGSVIGAEKGSVLGGGYTRNPALTRYSFGNFFSGDSNNGKDDPNSPNYTGKVNVSKDGSSKSPDTATGPNYAPVIVAVVTLIGTFAFAGTALKKKESSN